MRRKIVIDNKTHWSTPHLRRLISACANLECRAGEYPTLYVSIVYRRSSARSNHVSGYGWYHTPNFKICLPSHDKPNMASLAQIIVHELGHCRGIKHPDMKGDSWYRQVGNWRERYAWAHGFPLEKVEPKKSTKPKGVELVVAKAAKLQKKIKEWETKKKRALTMLKKYEKQLRYYERQHQKFAAKEDA